MLDEAVGIASSGAEDAGNVLIEVLLAALSTCAQQEVGEVQPSTSSCITGEEVIQIDSASAETETEIEFPHEDSRSEEAEDNSTVKVTPAEVVDFMIS